MILTSILSSCFLYKEDSGSLVIYNNSSNENDVIKDVYIWQKEKDSDYRLFYDNVNIEKNDFNSRTYWYELPEGSYSVKISVERQDESERLEFTTGANNFRKVEAEDVLTVKFNGSSLYFRE